MNFFFQKAGLLLIFLLQLGYTWAQNRIIGGHVTTIAKFPHMLSLQIGLKTRNLVGYCGASIIGKEWALTAKHCFDNHQADYNKISVIAGTTYLKPLDKTATKHKVIKVITTTYNRLVTGDIAVLKISPPFTYSNVIKPVKLPENGVAMQTNFATVTGWGDTWFQGNGSDRLLAVTVPKVETKQCKSQYRKKNFKVKKGEICYGFNNGTVIRDKCQGDSGGPLVNSDGIELGIVSYGVNCGTRGYPGVYIDVAYFRDWIKKKTGI